MKKWEYVLLAPIVIAALFLLAFFGWVLYLLALGAYDVFVVRLGYPLWGLISGAFFLAWFIIGMGYFYSRHIGFFEEDN